jgi:hypothetical protein
MKHPSGTEAPDPGCLSKRGNFSIELQIAAVGALNPSGEASQEG